MNKNRIFFSLALLMLTALAVNAQYKFKVTEVDFDKIKRETLDPNSRYYYPKLVKSFKSNDTIMNFEAYRNLYYGFIFQEDYNPFRHNDFEGKEEVEELYYKQPPLSREECDKIARYAERALDDNLFDIDQLNYYIYALNEKKKYARAAVRQYRLDKLIAAIMSSGRGTEEEPWVVISLDHEYAIINFLGYVAKDHQDLEGGIDVIKTVSDKDPNKTRDFYFDVSMMLQEAARKFPDDF